MKIIELYRGDTNVILYRKLSHMCAIYRKQYYRRYQCYHVMDSIISRIFLPVKQIKFHDITITFMLVGSSTYSTISG